MMSAKAKADVEKLKALMKKKGKKFLKDRKAKAKEQAKK